jgi:hypothetical protein
VSDVVSAAKSGERLAQATKRPTEWRQFPTMERVWQRRSSVGQCPDGAMGLRWGPTPGVAFHRRKQSVTKEEQGKVGGSDKMDVRPSGHLLMGMVKGQPRKYPGSVNGILAMVSGCFLLRTSTVNSVPTLEWALAT